jgi:hypothetical protein
MATEEGGRERDPGRHWLRHFRVPPPPSALALHLIVPSSHLTAH